MAAVNKMGVALGCVIPLVAQTCFVVLMNSFQWHMPFGGLSSLIFSAALGYPFWARSVQRSALGIAVIYIPLMGAVLFMYTLFLAAAVYGDYL